MPPVGSFVGLATIDLIYKVPSFPVEDSKNTAASFGVYAGGPAANAAATFSYLGGTTHLFAAIGLSPISRAITDDLGALNVTVHDLEPRRTEMPPVSSILVSGDDGLRTIVSSPSQDAVSPIDHLDLNTIGGSEVILLDGFNHAAAMAAAKHAKDSGRTVVLDGDAWNEAIPGLLKYVDIVIFGENFAVPGAKDFREKDLILKSMGVNFVANTRGPQSILYRDCDHYGEIEMRTRRVVDTLGAGDIFHGAFCYSLATGKDFERALRLASEVAGDSVEAFGTRAWMTKRVAQPQRG